MLTNLLTHTSKSISKISKLLNLGNGSTWPGHIALTVNAHIIEDLFKNSSTEVILVVGTNGKTTTSSIVATILKEEGKKIVRNSSGANLLNGIASTLLLHTNQSAKITADYAIFEVDENNLPLILSHITPKAIIALNLFRDQLDRYGELDSIAKKWNASFQLLPPSTTLILNADDPLMAFLAKDTKAHIAYFGLTEEEKGEKVVGHASDSIYCPQCGSRLNYKKVFYSHIGIWECPNCHVKRPLPTLSVSSYPLPGTYNKYNTLAAVLAAKICGISEKVIEKALTHVTPAFGRQEQLTYREKSIQIFLSKNPTSMNESLKTVLEQNNHPVIANDLPAGKAGVKQSPKQKEIASSHAPRNDESRKPTVLFVLNDRIPDGRDVSWIWDIEMEEYINKFERIIVSGDRAYDMGLRVQYSQKSEIRNPKSEANTKYEILNTKYLVRPNLKEAIDSAVSSVPSDETLYILPTYSAMLDVRKILTGRKIL